jgi:TRAP-type C4-dicarboxylate transport system permease small subunit
MTSRWKEIAGIALAWLVRIEQIVSVMLLTTIVVTMGAQVIWRYVLQAPLSWSEEIARLAMIWLTFIAAAFVSGKHQHIAVDLIGDEPVGGDKRSGPVRFVMRSLRSPRLVQCIILITTLSLLLGGLNFVLRVYPVGSPGVNISMSYWYGAASVGLALMSLHAIADLLGIRVPVDPSENAREAVDPSVQAS